MRARQTRVKRCNAGELEGSGDGEGSGSRPRQTPISKTHGENRRLVVLRGVLVGWKKAIMALAVGVSSDICKRIPVTERTVGGIARLGLVVSSKFFRSDIVG